MNNLQIFMTLLVLYWSDLITGPILYIVRKVEHWYDIKNFKREIEATKNMTTEEKLEKGYVREWKPEPYEPPTKIEEICWQIKSIFWYKILEHPEDFRNWLIHKFQRAKRGWSNRDTWCFHYFLATVIIGGLKHLKKTKHGVPNAFCHSKSDDNNAEFAKCIKRWDNALNCMIKTFETSIFISEDHWVYQNSTKYDIKQANYWRTAHKEWRKDDPKAYRKKELKVMTKKECKEYERGWALFQEHFWSLWD